MDIIYIYSMYTEDKKSDPINIIYTCKTTHHTEFRDLILEIKNNIKEIVLSEYHFTKPDYPKFKFYKYPSYNEFQFFKNPIKPLTIEHDGAIYLNEYFISGIVDNYIYFIIE